MYAWEQFHKATLSLVSQGSIKQRLVDAFSEIKDIQLGDLPEDVHQEFRTLNRELTRIPPFGDENPVCSTVRKMSNDEAVTWASRIVAIYDSISRSFNTANTLLINGQKKNGHNKERQFQVA